MYILYANNVAIRIVCMYGNNNVVVICGHIVCMYVCMVMTNNNAVVICISRLEVIFSSSLFLKIHVLK